MNIENYIEKREILGAAGLFSAHGSFGIVDYTSNYKKEEKEGKSIYTYEQNGIRMTAIFSYFSNGVVIRRDFFENLTDDELEINKLSSRFRMDANEYEVYTQYSSWQHESMGDWQKLVTQVTVETQGIRTCDGATPMLALHNLFTKRNIVFHLIPNCQWKMNVRKSPYNDRELVVVEIGLQDSALSLKVKPGERIDLPEILFYEAKNKTDLDAYKLHEVFNSLYPRRSLPVVYNSWLYCFDMLDVDNLLKQVDCAADLGFEAFMIDAGWFGTGTEWSACVGDWEECKESGTKGRLAELSARVREKGMIFGLWLEPERAVKTSKAMQAHPDYFINQTFLDFSNEKARAFILDAISKPIDEYKVGWVKFDYNATTPYDPSHTAFYRYWEGYRQFIKEFKIRYPHIYISNCGGGGFRMELGMAKMFDSFWFTDNQGPYDGIRIIKDTLKRLPTGCIERWNVQKYCEGFLEYGNPNPVGKMIHCNNATWDFLIGVQDSFSEEFMRGGPFGFSCDIDSFSQKYKERWKEIITYYKKERDFFSSATARILIDNQSMIAIEYADVDLKKCYIQVFVKTVYSQDIIVYPVLNSSREYRYEDRKGLGYEFMEDGILIENLCNNSCITLSIEAV